MRLLLAFTRIPVIFWLLIAGLLGYKTYHEWEVGPKVDVENEIKTKSEKIKKIAEDIKRAEEFQKLKDEKFKQLQDLQIKLNEASSKIPKTMDVPSLLKPLADIADKVSLQFVRYKPSQKFNKEFLVVYPLEVEFKGTYSQVMSFLDETAHLQRIIAARRIVFDNPQPKGTASLITARATLYAYSMDPNSSLAKGTK